MGGVLDFVDGPARASCISARAGATVFFAIVYLRAAVVLVARLDLWRRAVADWRFLQFVAALSWQLSGFPALRWRYSHGRGLVFARFMAHHEKCAEAKIEREGGSWRASGFLGSAHGHAHA